MASESKPIEMKTRCPEFNLKGVDGKLHNLSSYDQRQILVVGFTCNHCPYVQAYESRLIATVSKLKDQSVAFVCINANDAKTYPDDSFDQMVERANRLQFNFDYLHDETQSVARAFNAACTPEFYVYDEKRLLRYHGRLDDSPKDPQAVKMKYLENAVLSLLGGRSPEPSQTSAVGCSIKWRAQ